MTEQTCKNCQFWAQLADISFCQKDGEESLADDWCEAWEDIGEKYQRLNGDRHGS